MPLEIRFMFAAVLSLVCTLGHAQESRPARPEELTPISGESPAQFELRKKRITYGTPENQRSCATFEAIEVGLFKGGASGYASAVDRYLAWCVPPGTNRAKALAPLPALSREDYFDIDGDHWISRKEYCDRLASRHFTGRAARAVRKIYEKNCGPSLP
jgi:hypothetical protein